MQDKIQVWDLPLRIFHWFLVLSFFVAYFTEEDFLSLHVWAGYAVLASLIFRVIWGFVGNDYAQFSQFLCSPAASFQYLKDLINSKAKRYLGHNPAGSAMIVLLLISLSFTTVTGLAVYGADQGAGPFAFMGTTVLKQEEAVIKAMSAEDEYKESEESSESNDELWEELHEFSVNVTLLLVFIHILGVAVESFIHRENLVRAMLHGYKKMTGNSSDQR